jgi:hypothetical protein
VRSGWHTSLTFRLFAAGRIPTVDVGHLTLLWYMRRAALVTVRLA